MKSFSTQALFNLDIFCESKADLITLLQKQLQSKSKLLSIATPNPEQVIQSRENDEFLQDLQQFDLLLPDGQGLVWASKALGQPLSERIAGVEVVEWLVTHTDASVLIIGGRDYLKSEAGDQTKVRQLVIQGRKVEWIEGYKNIKNPTNLEEAQIEQAMKNVKPTIVLVALGAPWQERWVIQHKNLLEQSSVQIVMVVGGAIDMIFGKVKRAPQFIQDIQLEWLFRLLQEPWRWRRQLRLIRFIGLVFWKKFFK